MATFKSVIGARQMSVFFVVTGLIAGALLLPVLHFSAVEPS